ncbi:MAG: prepilin-type N-terminal cleavage/methylation domain-containing protein [Gammaproteobacteria bacterium]|nr:prepilin-type N-terminal cleavage/methylation domain-containing protein [Gammaproteobacteria bacterium]
MKNKKSIFYIYGDNDSGFTMVELLIAMFITSIVSAGIFSAYQSQQKAQRAQEQVVEMQQNLRAALYIISNEIRMAGYDPSRSIDAGIINAGNGSDSLNRLIFSYFNADAWNDGEDNNNNAAIDEPNENQQNIEYYLYDSTNDSDTTVDDLGRRNGSRLDAIAGNIQNLQFAYLDTTGTVMPLPIAATNLPDIRSIQITITAIPEPDPKAPDYANGRTLTTIVKCRNLGL